ncbi:BspA family leucine-rich repeat surface protein [Vibrio cyclitrophicus]
MIKQVFIFSIVLGLSACNETQDTSQKEPCEDNQLNRNQLLQLVKSYNDSPVPSNIKAIESACVGKIKNFTSVFEGSEFNGDLKYWDLSSATNLSKMFKNAQSFEGHGLESWDVSNVHTMYATFDSAYLFNGKIGNWDTKSLIDAPALFSSAHAFNQPIGNWNTSKVQDMSSMFSFTKSFNQDLNWDTSSVFSFSQMFYGSKSFNGNVSGFSVKQAADLSFMFSSAKSFNQDLSDWDLEGVIDLRSYKED